MKFRMYWAKKILEWTSGPEEALATSIYLNDKVNIFNSFPSVLNLLVMHIFYSFQSPAVSNRRQGSKWIRRVHVVNMWSA